MKNLKSSYERARQTKLETRKNFFGPMKKFLENLVNLENYDVITRDWNSSFWIFFPHEAKELVELIKKFFWSNGKTNFKKFFEKFSKIFQKNLGFLSAWSYWKSVNGSWKSLLNCLRIIKKLFWSKSKKLKKKVLKNF